MASPASVPRRSAFIVAFVNATGSGAIHVRTFHAKLTSDALEYMDQCINEWLDAHPQYEVKFTCSTVGTVTSKIKEPNIICQVWV